MFAGARLTLLDEISARLERVGTNEAFMAMSSVQAAREQAAKITSEQCSLFLEAWEQDHHRFQAIAAKTSNVGSYAEAFDHLQLTNWRSAEFANADLARMPSLVDISSPAARRRSSAAGAPRRGRRPGQVGVHQSA